MRERIILIGPQSHTVRRDSFRAEGATCRRSLRAIATGTTIIRSKETLCGRSLECGVAEGTEPGETSRAKRRTLRCVAVCGYTKEIACRTSLRSVIIDRHGIKAEWAALCRRSLRAIATETTIIRSKETLCGRSLGCDAAEGTEPGETSRAERRTLRCVAVCGCTKEIACRTSLRSVILGRHGIGAE